MVPMCEWCGQTHAKDQLCASRPKWSRRGFLALFGAGIAGAVVAAKIPSVGLEQLDISPVAVFDGTYGGINRATFAFWRNQQLPATTALDSLRLSMRQLTDAPFGPPQPDYITVDIDTLRRYEQLLAR